MLFKFFSYGFFIFFTLQSCSQKTNITTVTFEIINDDAGNGYTALYPMVTTGNKKVDSIINHYTAESLILEPIEEDRIEDAIKDWFVQGKTAVSYTVSRMNETYISFQIFAEYYGGAYPTSQTFYFNFSSSTGASLSLNDVLADTGEVEKRLDARFRTVIDSAKTILKNRSVENEEIESSTASWVMRTYDSCLKNSSMNNFKINDNHITIFKDCELPHAIKSFNLRAVVEEPIE